MDDSWLEAAYEERYDSYYEEDFLFDEYHNAADEEAWDDEEFEDEEDAYVDDPEPRGARFWY